jgi:hypothetical protein
MVFSGQISRLSGSKTQNSKFNSGTREARGSGRDGTLALDLTQHPEFKFKTAGMFLHKSNSSPKAAFQFNPGDLGSSGEGEPPCHQLALRTAVVAM